MVNVFISLPFSRGVWEKQFPSETSVSELIEKVLVELGLNLNPTHFEAYLNDSEKELSKKDSLKDLKICDHDEITISKCKKIKVSVLYAGFPTFIDTYNPNNKISKVKKEAIRHFEIDQDQRGTLALYTSSDTKNPLEEDSRVSAISEVSDCSLVLYLSKKIDYLG